VALHQLAEQLGRRSVMELGDWASAEEMALTRRAAISQKSNREPLIFSAANPRRN
jgi:hypothetical protein